ncbi:2-keto-4-pentenoate hydratase/2-oxohepta-3-ene-1,7-dioic acid hydratase in catechol pathway [Amycolatopsis echigonensis]|uniref:2-keto-4-pentenoate hydratase/2-oxohepta-3-ene-1,7-dioic acid hydratase in catechol pathway n=1 Tax=Amycolatopsis echigonensis TaxID=2576905 RepID=A0A2N3WB67_9PSEU|nr:fumarylacetoacetate hydrolase family protein [Amycolatopsis niigatensis]PKV91130.1 2-keto-4-pentenoate hydratase/2-oxohepta-3-ene-1,7-dioic acid hydratase in catechol pathway [Amycolatopsis niigatensis]
MRFVRLGAAGAERPFVRAGDGTLHDLSGVTPDIDGAFLAGDGPAKAARALEAGELPVADGAGLRVGAPIAAPGKIVCIGMNYRRHAEETGAPVPTEPVLFMKAPDVMVGPFDEVLVPRGSTATDWEVELGVVIGKTARYLESADEALAHVAGYVVSNDVSERDFQLNRGGQWDKGKNCETFNPLGPELVTADEIPDPQALGLRTWVNGAKVQDSSTKDMVFTVAEIIHYLSQFMVLRPGDLINTGTPEGVALGQPEPKPYLRAGDVVELEIDGLGKQRQTLGQA